MWHRIRTDGHKDDAFYSMYKAFLDTRIFETFFSSCRVHTIITQCHTTCHSESNSSELTAEPRPGVSNVKPPIKKYLSRHRQINVDRERRRHWCIALIKALAIVAATRVAVAHTARRVMAVAAVATVMVVRVATTVQRVERCARRTVQARRTRRRHVGLVVERHLVVIVNHGGAMVAVVAIVAAVVVVVLRVCVHTTIVGGNANAATLMKQGRRTLRARNRFRRQRPRIRRQLIRRRRRRRRPRVHRIASGVKGARVALAVVVGVSLARRQRIRVERRHVHRGELRASAIGVE